MLPHMRVKTITGNDADVADDEILRAAGLIYQSRRQGRNGAEAGVRVCLVRRVAYGPEGLEEHTRNCGQSLGSQWGLWSLADLL
jgi:hypothetical protein